MPILLAIVFFVLCSVPSHAELPFFNAFTRMLKVSVEIMPEASFDGDFKIYTNQKSDAFQKKYCSEQNMNADLAFVRVGKRFYWMFRPELKAGLGNSQAGMVLHPYDASFGLIPTFEYRLEKIHVYSGLDHRCFHLIDRKPSKIESIVYWNKCIVGASSPHRRIHPLLREYVGSQGLFDKLIWNLSWGYYITDFFDMVASYKLMSPERPQYLHDFNLGMKYGIVNWRSASLMVTEASMLGFTKNGSVYWSQEIGAEAITGCRTFDASLFLCCTFDGGRFDSKDQLFEVGIRVIK